jgi:hypothetical protein
MESFKMKKISLFLILAFCLSLAGCSKDAEVNAFITEFDSATKEIVSKIDANPSSAGIDDAQKALDGKKASLKTKWEAIKSARGFQVGADTKKKLEDSVSNNMKALMDVSTKNMAKLAMDKDAAAKFQKLLTDFGSMFGQPTR